MNDHLTDITMILDRSGSMGHIADDVLGGVNEFIRKQKAAEGRALFTLVQFDTEAPHEVIHDAVDVQQVGTLTDYHPRSGTPLLDAVGTGIVRTGKRLAAMDEAQRPAQVVFVVVTDGAENSSTDFSADQVRAMIKEQETKYNWQFVFLAADATAFASAGSYGFSAGKSGRVGKDGQSIRHAMAVSSSNVSRYRKSKAAADLDFDADERVQMSGESPR